MPGMGELIIILLIVLVVFGANKLPGIGDALGRSIKNFKKASTGEDDAKVIETSKGQIESGAKKELASADGDDSEWEEVVVRRKKKKEA